MLWYFTFVRNFIIKSRTVFSLQSGHKYMVIIPKVCKPELRLVCSARRLIVLYICVRFRENISDGIRVMERTQMMEALTDGQTAGRIHKISTV